MHVDEEGGEVVVARPGRSLADDLADVGEVRSGCPHLLAGDEPVIAVGGRLRLDGCEVRARPGFAEQLAGDEVAAVEGRQVPALLSLVGVAQDGGRDHAQAHGQRCVARHFELTGQAVEGSLVALGQPRAAVLLRARDPRVPCIPQRRPPGADAWQGVGLLHRVRLLEDADLVAALAPPKPAALLCREARVAGFQPGFRSRQEFCELRHWPFARGAPQAMGIRPAWGARRWRCPA